MADAPEVISYFQEKEVVAATAPPPDEPAPPVKPPRPTAAATTPTPSSSNPTTAHPSSPSLSSTTIQSPHVNNVAHPMPRTEPPNSISADPDASAPIPVEASLPPHLRNPTHESDAPKLPVHPTEDGFPPKYRFGATDQSVRSPVAEVGCRPLQPDHADAIFEEHHRQHLLQPHHHQHRSSISKSAISQPEQRDRTLSPPQKGGSEWSAEFWDCCGSGSLALESILCPCVLAGRNHNRIRNPEDEHPSSTNSYCLSCCGLMTLGIVGIPAWLCMTVATRREEAREIDMREKRRAEETKGYGRRDDSMVYEKKN